MIYLLDVKIDYNLAGPDLEALMPSEWEQTEKLFRSGRLIGIWRKASAKGVVAIWNMPDHDAVIAQIREMPLYPYMTDISVEPLVAHPKYPGFCTGPVGAHEAD